MSSPNPKGVPLLDVGRDVHGRFRKANPGGPGNPFARKVAALRKAVLDSVSEQDLKDMVEILKGQARQGDKAAIKLILQYCVGKPAPPNDPDRMDVDEWDRLQQMRVAPKQFSKTMESVPACIACHLAQTSWPCEAQDGPLAEDVAYLHSRLRADDRAAPAPDKPVKDAAPDGARPAAAAAGQRTAYAQSGAAAPTAERPSSAKETRKASERREPADEPRDDSHSPTQPPSSNGGNGEGRRQAPEQLQPLRQPPRPPGQPEPEPPRR